MYLVNNYMVSFKQYFQLNESIQSVELMSTILNQKPIIDQWTKEFKANGGVEEWGDLESFLEDHIGIDRFDLGNGLLINLKLFKSPIRIKSIIDKATARIPEKFRIILNDMIHPDFIGLIRLPDDQMNAIKTSIDAITLVIQPSDDPITVWMISHRIGHAIEHYTRNIYDEISKIIDQYVDSFKHIHGVIYSNFEDNKFKGSYDKLSRFKSAQTNNVNSFYEYINDLIAEYCHYGRIEFVMPDLSSISEKDALIFKRKKLEIEDSIGSLIKSALTQLHGRVLIA